MTQLLISAMVTLLLIPAGAFAGPQDCEATPERYAFRITPVGTADVLGARPSVSGERSFYQTLDNGWVFALQRVETGWQLRLFDGEPTRASVDLTQLTPPLRGAPNPRELLGWHFRNDDNTAPNEGSVNAPQETRVFVISPVISGTGGFKPSGGGLSPDPNDGLGVLEITDYGLRNPRPGEKAVMNYLEFEACLYWPRPPDETAQILDSQSLNYIPEEQETFGACGLDLTRQTLSAAYGPRTLGGDFDGDGSIDEAAQIQVRASGRRAIALCRGGTWLHVIGAEAIPGALYGGYVDQVEAWHWVRTVGDLPRRLSGFDLPDADGDILILERIDKEAVAFFWKDGQLDSEQMYRHVEP